MLQFLLKHGYASVIVTIILTVLTFMTDEFLFIIIIPITLVAAIFDEIFQLFFTAVFSPLDLFDDFFSSPPLSLSPSLTTDLNLFTPSIFSFLRF